MGRKLQKTKALWPRGKKLMKSSPKSIFVDELLSQLLTLCLSSGEVAGGVQVFLPQAGRYSQRRKASLKW